MPPPGRRISRKKKKNKHLITKITAARPSVSQSIPQHKISQGSSYKPAPVIPPIRNIKMSQPASPASSLMFRPVTKLMVSLGSSSAAAPVSKPDPKTAAADRDGSKKL